MKAFAKIALIMYIKGRTEQTDKWTDKIYVVVGLMRPFMAWPHKKWLYSTVSVHFA